MLAAVVCSGGKRPQDPNVVESRCGPDVLCVHAPD